MVKKIQKKSSSSSSSAKTASKASGKASGKSPLGNGPLASAVRDSAQQIWLAGLGAFSKAQEEGGKVFDTLVREGVTLQRKTQEVAGDRITEASSRVTNMASDITNRAAGQWDKLESIFEERVAKALGKLGVPSGKDIDELMDRVQALTSHVQSLAGLPADAKPARKAAPRKTAAAKKPAAKKAAAKAPAAKKAPARKAAPRKKAEPKGDAE